jgi:hypothetical protein
MDVRPTPYDRCSITYYSAIIGSMNEIATQVRFPARTPKLTAFYLCCRSFSDGNKAQFLFLLGIRAIMRVQRGPFSSAHKGNRVNQ